MDETFHYIYLKNQFVLLIQQQVPAQNYHHTRMMMFKWESKQ